MIFEMIVIGSAAIVVIVLLYFMAIDNTEHESRGCVQKYVGSHTEPMMVGKIVMPVTTNDYEWVCPK